MLIREYIEQIEKDNTTININDIPFTLSDINDDNFLDLDISEKTKYDENRPLSFLERLDMAAKEIESLTKDMTKAEAIEYFKEETEPGNINYWGGMFFIYTHDINPNDKDIYLGIRMD